MLMCTTRSVYPWDIVLTREGDKLFMDKREGGPFGEQYYNISSNVIAKISFLMPFRLQLRQRKCFRPTT